jgi:hypothetical protein
MAVLETIIGQERAVKSLNFGLGIKDAGFNNYVAGLPGMGLILRGTTIVAMYPHWLLGLLILYPLCRGYGGFKQRQPVNSILRFL